MTSLNSVSNKIRDLSKMNQVGGHLKYAKVFKNCTQIYSKTTSTNYMNNKCHLDVCNIFMEIMLNPVVPGMELQCDCIS